MARRLKEEYQKVRDDFEEDYGFRGCSCHINPPCGYCTHPGNPTNLEETEDAWEEEDPDKDRGLYGKFFVIRTDGSSGPGGKHENCSYFVLDLNHDKFARAAIKAYADACREEYPKLSDDLYEYALSEHVESDGNTESCPECGAPLIIKWSGIYCSKCIYAFCF